MKPTPCTWCNESGQVPVDPNDRRKGTTTCPKCEGHGDV